MEDQRRSTEHVDRRAHPRGGRRGHDRGKPWYMRRRLWLAVASLAFVSWRRMTHKTQPAHRATDAAA